MKSTATVSKFDGMDLWTVKVGNLTARGQAPVGSRPQSWMITPAVGKWHLRTTAAGVRETKLLRRRELSAALKAVETGRI